MAKIVYGRADKSSKYFYTLSKDEIIKGIEHQAKNKVEFEKIVRTGQVLNYRVETNEFYFLV